MDHLMSIEGSDMRIPGYGAFYRLCHRWGFVVLFALGFSLGSLVGTGLPPFYLWFS